MFKKLLSIFLYLFVFQAFAGSQLVVVYSTSWCGHCKSTKNYLQAKKIEFTNCDIESSLVCKQQFNALNGYGVPLIYVGETRIEGFDKNAIEKALIAYGLLK